MSEQSPAPAVAPAVENIRNYYITVPAGASREAQVLMRAVDWTDCAQTVRPNVIGGAWICVHAGVCWPDACEYCEHIAALSRGRS